MEKLFLSKAWLKIAGGGGMHPPHPPGNEKRRDGRIVYYFLPLIFKGSNNSR